VSQPERQHPRYAHEVAIRVRHGKNGSSKVVEGRTRNVSGGGLCANVEHAIATGADVIVDITLVFDDDMQSEALSLGARIAWCTTVDDEYQIGVSFKPLAKQQSEFLQLFLKYLGEEKTRPSRGPRVEKNIDDRFG
jgi:hypothetical protein